MLTRIVKMEFEPEKVDEFLTYFDTIQKTIREQPGCTDVYLMQDLNNPRIVFSFSAWEAGNYLEQYLKTDFFRGVWAKTKPLFNSNKPMAWSVGAVNNK